jgi:hypothetical protein
VETQPLLLSTLDKYGIYIPPKKFKRKNKGERALEKRTGKIKDPVEKSWKKNSFEQMGKSFRNCPEIFPLFIGASRQLDIILNALMKN